MLITRPFPLNDRLEMVMNSPEDVSVSRTSSFNILNATGVLDRSISTTELRLDDGRVLRLPTSLLEEDDTYLVAATDRSVALPEETETIPLIEERLQVGKRVVTTGTVRLRKSVQSFETSLDEPLAVRSYDIERIVLNQPVESAPGVRHEGDTTIYPLVEEQLILTKQLILKEEVRVTRRDTERRDTQTVTLRRESLEVEREPR